LQKKKDEGRVKDNKKLVAIRNQRERKFFRFSRNEEEKTWLNKKAEQVNQKIPPAKIRESSS